MIDMPLNNPLTDLDKKRLCILGNMVENGATSITGIDINHHRSNKRDPFNSFSSLERLESAGMLEGATFPENKGTRAGTLKHFSLTHVGRSLFSDLMRNQHRK
jgi:hypothetical protein